MIGKRNAEFEILVKTGGGSQVIVFVFKNALH